MTTSRILTFSSLRSQKEKKDKGVENLFEEIIGENFPDLGKETYIQVQEAWSPKQNRPKEVHTKIQVNAKIKDKQRICKATRKSKSL